MEMTPEEEEKSREIISCATAIMDMLQDKSSPSHVTGVLVFASSMLFSRMLDNEGQAINAEIEIDEFCKRIKTIVKDCAEADIDPMDVFDIDQKRVDGVKKKICDKEAVVISSGWVDTINQIEDPDVVLKMLAAVSSYFISNRFATEESAMYAYQRLNGTIQHIISASKQSGLASWVRGTPH